MLLIGMFDSPFVRRVAISMATLNLPFEHADWSVGKDFARIREHNPLGRVPTLVLDDGEALIESAAILDHLDQLVGAEHALLPPTGKPRRDALRLMALAVGAAEKGVAIVYERAFRPEDKRHQPWVDRCRAQVQGALAELERVVAACNTQWLLGARMLQPDITVACVFTFLTEAAGIDAAAYPATKTFVARCEALPVFAQFKLAFFTPNQ